MAEFQLNCRTFNPSTSFFVLSQFLIQLSLSEIEYVALYMVLVNAYISVQNEEILYKPITDVSNEYISMLKAYLMLKDLEHDVTTTLIHVAKLHIPKMFNSIVE